MNFSMVYQEQLVELVSMNAGAFHKEIMPNVYSIEVLDERKDIHTSIKR